MNQQQVASTIRSILIGIGAFAAGKGWIGSSDAAFIGSDTAMMIIGGIVALGTAAYGAYTHRATNAVAVVAAMPEVAQVQMTPTPEGRAIASTVGSTPEATVTIAPKAA